MATTIPIYVADAAVACVQELGMHADPSPSPRFASPDRDNGLSLSFPRPILPIPVDTRSLLGL